MPFAYNPKYWLSTTNRHEWGCEMGSNWVMLSSYGSMRDQNQIGSIWSLSNYFPKGVSESRTYLNKFKIFDNFRPCCTNSKSPSRLFFGLWWFMDGVKLFWSWVFFSICDSPGSNCEALRLGVHLILFYFGRISLLTPETFGLFGWWREGGGDFFAFQFFFK